MWSNLLTRLMLPIEKKKKKVNKINVPLLD